MSTKELRMIRAKQMSGAAVSMALKPSRGLRDDIILAGGKPKDHNKENYQRLKELERMNKMVLQEKEKPAPPPFKLKQFDTVPAKLVTRRSASSSSISSELNSVSASSRPSSANSGASTSSSRKNFIHINAERVKSPQLKRSVSTPDVHEPRRATPLGELPRYLVDRKSEWAKQEMERVMALEVDKIPKGMTVVSEEERLETLRILKAHQAQLLKELSSFGLVVETQRMKMKKANVESRLKEVEEGIDMFSRKKVYIVREDESRNVSFSEVGNL